MIYLASPTFNFDGLIVMRDDTDPLQYYYYPSNPQLALNPDGTPTFLFVRFKTDAPVPPGVESGGGFLNFDVDLRVDPDTLDDAKRQIRSQMNLNDDPRLVPLEYRTGTTRLIFLDAATPAATTTAGAAPATTVTVTGTASAAASATAPAIQFVESASYSATPSLYGLNRSAFSVALSPQGATLVKACLDTPTFLAGVVYDLTFVGLRPAFHVTLVVDWNQVYSYMENQFHASAKVPFVSIQSDIDDATEKLIEQRVIQINVVSYAAGTADADITKEKDSATDFVKKMVTDSFFKPSIPPKGLSGDTSNKTVQTVKDATSPVSMGYSLKMLNSQDVKNMNVNLTEQDAMEVRIVPQGHLAGLMSVLKNQPLENYYREVDLNDPFFQRVRVDVGVSSVFSTDHVDSVVVNLQYAGANSQPMSLTLNSTTPSGSASWELDPSIGMTYTYTVTIAFKPDSFTGDATEVTGSVRTSNTPKIVIDPHDYYTIVNVDIQAPAIPWKTYAQVLVELASDEDKDGAKLQAFTLTSAAPKATWSYRPADPTKAGYRFRKTYVPAASPPVVVDWAQSDSPVILVSDLATDVLSIFVTTNLDFAKVPRVLVAMEYKDPANGLDYTEVLQLSSATSYTTWARPIIDKTKRDYTYAVTLLYADHTVKSFPAVPSTDTVLAVLDTYSRTMNVVVSASGDDFASAGLDRIEAVLSYSDGSSQAPAPSTIVLRSLSDTGIFTYQAHDPAHQAYTYAATYFSKDGFNRQIASTSSDTLSLVFPIQTG
jgi:hypothetical protein